MRLKLLLRDFGLVVVAIVIGAGITYGITQYQQAHSKQSTVLAAQAEANALLTQVGKLMELPNETPTIATVSDVTKLKNQAFFSDAKNGDKVLIYVQAKKAILFRPSENKIIDVAPVNIQNTPAPQPTTVTVSPTQTPTPTASPRTRGVRNSPTPTATQ